MTPKEQAAFILSILAALVHAVEAGRRTTEGARQIAEAQA